MPGVTWQEVSEFELEYPERSRTLERLVLRFDWDEITVHIGPHHQHFTADEGDIDEQAERIPRPGQEESATAYGGCSLRG